jgi:hypothetical protein
MILLEWDNSLITLVTLSLRSLRTLAEQDKRVWADHKNAPSRGARVEKRKVERAELKAKREKATEQAKKNMKAGLDRLKKS